MATNRNSYILYQITWSPMTLSDIETPLQLSCSNYVVHVRLVELLMRCRHDGVARVTVGRHTALLWLEASTC